MDFTHASKKFVKKYWNENPCGKISESFEESRNYRYTQVPSVLGILGDIVKIGKGKKILEVGCGQGIDSCELALKGMHVTGIDLTEKAIGIANQRKKYYNLKNVNFLQADAENLPFENESFDIVYSYGVLHHTPNTQKAFDEIKRVLKPKGIIIVMLYNKLSFSNMYRVIRGFEMETDKKPTLVKVYSKNYIINNFLKAFDILSVQYDSGTHPKLPKFINKFIEKRFGFFMTLQAMKK